MQSPAPEDNPRDQLGATQLEGSFAEKDLGVLVDTMWNINQHRALATKKANGVLSYIESSDASRLKEVTLSAQHL